MLPRVAGVSLTIAGTGALAFGAFEYLQTTGAYGDYLDMVDQAELGIIPVQEVEDHYQQEVRPRKTRLQAASAVGTVLLASGVTLVVTF